MSAFLVEDSHIDFLLSFMLSQRCAHAKVYQPSRRRWFDFNYDILEADTRRTAMDIVGQILIDENYRSLSARYGERAGELFNSNAQDDKPHTYRFAEHSSAIDSDRIARAVQVLKSAACYDYQACESDDYEQTDAARIVRDIVQAAIHSLPGYEAAQWGAPERPARGPVSLSAIAAGRA